MTASHPRKPPSFQHLPANRAKHLKQKWVEKQKIKTQWRAQKKRELISKPTHSVNGPNCVAPNEVASNDNEVPHHDTYKHLSHESSPTLDEQPTRPFSHSERSLQSEPGSGYHKQKNSFSRTNPQRKQKAPPLQDLPVKTQCRSSRPRTDSISTLVKRKRGQPNMGERMNRMLEQIKRDFV